MQTHKDLPIHRKYSSEVYLTNPFVIVTEIFDPKHNQSNTKTTRISFVRQLLNKPSNISN